jgi:phosphate starvation-inducible membrane PsiE
MVWYEKEPFHWILKNLSARQITTLIVAGAVVIVFLFWYYIHLDTVRALSSKPLYLSIYQWAVVFIIVLVFIFVLPLDIPSSWELTC